MRQPRTARAFGPAGRPICGCRVIVDRRLAERRRVEHARAAEERRRGDRRSSHLEHSQGFVVLLR